MPAKKSNVKILSSYMDEIYRVDQHAKIMRKLTRSLSRRRFDAIAFTGTSGAAVAYPLSLRLKKPLICVRKEKAHSDRKVEGAYGAKNYIIVDDFISSGRSNDRIRRAVKAAYTQAKYPEPKCVGIYLYREELADPRKDYAGIPVRKL